MSISVARIRSILEQDGFVLVGNNTSGQSSFRRTASQSHLFEWIIVDCAGRQHEAVVGSIATSVTKCILTKGLMEMRLLDEIAGIEERGWTIVDSIRHAKEWEAQLAKVAPMRSAEMATEVGPDILERTKLARIAVGKYLGSLTHMEDVDIQLKLLRGQAKQYIVADAERLANWPGVLQVAGAEAQYLLATLCVLYFQRHVEDESFTFMGSDPLENDQLMWRIQLLADNFLAGSK